MTGMKLRLLLTLTSMVATLGACSTISDRQTYSYPLPPQSAIDVWGRDPLQTDQHLENQHRANSKSEPLTLLIRYQQAKLWLTKDPAKSCALWTEVLSEPRFPLARIARLHAMEVCPADKLVFPTIDEVLLATPEPWLEELVSRSSLARSRNTANEAWEMRLSFKVATFEKLQSEKIKLLQRAKELAQKLGDPNDAAAATSKIEGLAPRFILNPPDDLLMKAAADFKQAREFEQARVLYQKAVASAHLNSFEKLKALDGIRMSYKLEKKTDAFLESSQTYSDFAKNQFLKRGRQLIQDGNSEGRALLAKYFETRMALAKAIWTEGRPGEAQTILKTSEDDVHGFIPTYDSVLTRARIEEEAGHFEKTVALLNEIDPDKVPNHDTRMKILWYRAWNLRKAGHLKESALALGNLIPQEESAILGARDKFWYARTLRETGETEKAEAAFQDLIDTDNLGWYSLLAYRELKRPIPSLAAPAMSPQNLQRSPAGAKQLESAFMPEERLTFEWLLAAGENELAEKFLDQVTKDRKSAYSEAQNKDLLQIYARAGQFQALFTKLYELPSEQRKDLLLSNPELLFPQPWNALVKTAGAKFDVETELIYSIMRQESSFNPLARSPADAFGLMQLIPEMAKKAEQTSGIQIGSHEDLYRPETNIPLGAAFVHDLLERWHGGFIPTVASYNASEKAISGWVKSRYRGDPLVFIEDVPYEETRNYIKLVMRNFIFYKRLNSGGAPVPFPEWCLANLQDVKP
jgi:soluble lytic murein transglycosylase